MYDGLVPALIGGIPAGAVFFGVKDYSKRALKRSGIGKAEATVLSVAAANIPYWYVLCVCTFALIYHLRILPALYWFVVGLCRRRLVTAVSPRCLDLLLTLAYFLLICLVRTFLGFFLLLTNLTPPLTAAPPHRSTILNTGRV